MTGVVAMPSGKWTLAASPVDSTGTHQATPSARTFELVIALATSLVFCTLAPGSVQAGATPGFADVTGAPAEPAAGPAEHPDAADGFLPLVQPAAVKAAAMSMITQLKLAGLTGGLIRSP